MILVTGVADLAADVGQTRTLAGAMVAGPGSGVGAEHVALAGLTVLLQGVAVVVGLADLAVEAVGVVETLETPAGLGVAVARSVQIGVVVAVAGLTLSARCLRVAVVVVGAGLATRTRVALVALADNVLGHRVQGTAVRVSVATFQGSCIMRFHIVL